ncbi:MaoC/PaaZ C-terminal domain-containing protein [Streptomyces scopuliridis]|uniref:MaoC/PaaZ C-terminal domain-containing protein n=1 Tax=Streptomyces scopuliridis TaxID=452529 RepID=A0ACD4ZWF3_9ACTN|nr:MaoC/PaaZ C-terminal domain-containing protein [Streptomyces scopuliridis]WSB38064.1 MaoC/PaaZ C-terminal domain-containing protein [Streptomyces scopuliridis]WSC02496.1 MaoC/PaaZ C-terminal domain-containing protein [Streptomyces scopuliridis]WSC03971.1 MaoC/PaaZ C-terminal domain-containing protein [Streptomyces scopuliridis]
MTTAPAPAATRTVTAEEIAAYRGAVRAALPAARDQLASPVHAFVLAHTVAERTVAALTADDPGPVSVVHLGQDIRCRRLVRPGEQVTVRLDVLGARREPRGIRVALRSRLTGDGADSTDPKGSTGSMDPDAAEPFAELVTSALLVGATALEPFGEISGGAAAPAPTGAAEPATVVHEPTVEWIRRYALASGDENPIHLDADAARAAGFGSVIAHGMSVLALAVEEITDRYADGDAARIRGIGGRFSAPVAPGEPLRFDLQPDAARRVVRFSCRTPAGPAVKSGWVELTEHAASAQSGSRP